MTTKLRGFASMDTDTQRRIASMGGKAAHAAGTAHTWDRASASLAGKKGVAARAKNLAAARTPAAR